MLTDFLIPNVRKIKLLSPIAPIKRYVDDTFSDIDLNTTARKELKKLNNVQTYLDFGSYLVVTFDLAYEIGTFKMPEKKEEA